jgi:hypothetical protein
MAAPVEHHWNGQWGWARLDIYLERDGDLWTVRALQRQGLWGEDVWAGLDEPRARRYVEILKRDAPGLEPWHWRDVATRTDD